VLALREEDLRKLFGRVQDPDGELLAPRSHSRLFRDGLMVNLLNPKTALFFFAFLPQFAEPERGNLAMQIAFLGVEAAGLVWILLTPTAPSDRVNSVTPGTEKPRYGIDLFARGSRRVSATDFVRNDR